MFDRPRMAGAVCLSLATAFGLLYLHVAGAPPRMLLVNAGSLLVVWALLLVCRRVQSSTAIARGVCSFAGLALLVTALRGVSSHGATRWVSLHGFVLEPSMVLLPLAVVLFARAPEWWSATGMMVCAMALTMQPDRSMAGGLFAGVLAATWRGRWRLAVPVVGVVALCFAFTMHRADAVPPAPFVEHVFVSAFAVHAWLGIAVVAGALLLLLPGLVLPVRRERCTFVAVWAGLMLAAALGNYPTPVVGYGSSAILGYGLSLIAL